MEDKRTSSSVVYYDANNDSHTSEQSLPHSDQIQSNVVGSTETLINMGARSTVSKRRAYFSVGILCFINLINYMDRYTLAGVLGDIKKYYGLDDSEAGLLQTSFIVSYMLTAPIFGWLGDRYSRRLIIAFGITFWSVTTFLGSCIPSKYFAWFITLRALVGTGEASYSAIAPTIIGDLFTNSARTQMLALFYFAIPVGSGLAYIIGPYVAKLIGEWYWALRITPALGIASVILCLTVLADPPRGEAEGGVKSKTTSVIKDIIQVLKIPSFVLVSIGFTCVSFSVGALAWWVPDYMNTAFEASSGHSDKTTVTMIFGAITCFAGIAGVVLGSACSQYYRRFNARADPIICGYSMIAAAPLVYFACILASSYATLCYVLIFCGVTLLCMNWVIVTDIALYVVVPTRRSMAQAIQITLSHTLGDACSPYLVGAVSDAISDATSFSDYTSMEYALFLPVFILVLGAAFFFISSFYIVEDKEKCHLLSHGLTVPAVHIPNYTSENLPQECPESTDSFNDSVQLVT